MNTQKVGIGEVSLQHSKERVVIDINEIPYPTAIYYSLSKEVVLNRLGYENLGMKYGDKFDLNRWRKINPDFFDILSDRKTGIVTNQRIHIILFNGKHEIMNYSSSRIVNPFLGEITIINFYKASDKYSVASISSLYNIKEEVAKLKPYLNRSGKTILDNLMRKYFKEDNQQLTLDDLVYYEKELRVIQKTYPSLSHREVILCGLLVNNMESKDIATITNRTLDSVFVTIHRINKKLDFLNKKELVDTLKEVVNKDDEDNWLIEEFEV